MEKQSTSFATLSQQESNFNAAALTGLNLTETGKKLSLTLRGLACRLRDHYSALLQQPLTLRQTGLLVQAQLAFIVAALPMDAPLLMRSAATAWLIAALLKCKKEI